MADQTSKQTLRVELDSVRRQLGDYTGALRQDLNVGARLKTGVARHPVAWFAAAAVLGLLLSKIGSSCRHVVVKVPRVKDDQVKKAGTAAFGLTALKFGLDFAKPAIMRWVGKNVVDRFASRTATTGQDHSVK